MIQINNLYKKYNHDDVLKNINLHIRKNELVTILGPSGCGKTTLLRTINKLVLPDKGSIEINGKNIETMDSIALRRSIGYAVQRVGLFPHMTVADNISYVLSLQKSSSEERWRVAKELIIKMGLDSSYLSKYPDELSGGEKQRIGVARAFAGGQEIILMDEPFGAVDELQKTKLQDDLLEMQKTSNKTIVFVTHDIFEAFKLGNRVVLMDGGEIQQVGTPEEFVTNPSSAFVRDFLGPKAFLANLNGDDMEHLVDYMKQRNLS